MRLVSRLIIVVILTWTLVLAGCGGTGGPVPSQQGVSPQVAGPANWVFDSIWYRVAVINSWDADCFSKGGPSPWTWQPYPAGTYGGFFYTAADANNNWGRWEHPDTPAHWEVNISVHIPGTNTSTTQNARYDIHYRDGFVKQVLVNQRDHANQWLFLGKYNLPGRPYVTMGDATVVSEQKPMKYVIFDKVKFTWPDNGLHIAMYSRVEPSMGQFLRAGGWCLWAVSHWSQRGIPGGIPNANAAADWFQARGLLRTGNPLYAPVGSWIFYNVSPPYGHVGIKCDDGGKMVCLDTDGIVRHHSANYLAVRGYVTWEDMYLNTVDYSG